MSMEEKYKEFIAQVTAHDGLMGAHLSNCQICSTEGDEVILGVLTSHKFLFDKLRLPSVKRGIETMVGKFYGKKVSFALIDANKKIVYSEQSAPASVFESEKSEKKAKEPMFTVGEPFCGEDYIATIVGELYGRQNVLGKILETFLAKDIERITTLYRALVETAESPIEMQFLDALSLAIAEAGLKVGRAEGGETLGLTGQEQIAHYRADFVVRGFGKKVVIECDGHDFHDRTKEQAKSDRQRDRDMQAKGFAIFRFTGSEIHNGAGHCAREVLNFLMKAAA